MSLLLFHFPKPEEKDRTEVVNNVDEILSDVFRKADLEQFEFPERVPSLHQLYKKKSTTRHELIELIRYGIVEILHNYCGMGTYLFQSRDDDEIFCKVQCSDDILREEAEVTSYMLQMNKDLENIPKVKEIMPYIPFSRLKNENLYAKYNGNIFRNVDRIRLMERIIRSHLNIEMLVKHEVLIDFFPLHEENEVKTLKSSLLNYSQFSINLPIDQIRNYFGEQIAYYYIWLQFYINRLFFLSILGISLWLLGSFKTEKSNDGSMSLYAMGELAFAIIVCIWGAFFQIFWERISKFYAIKFGTQNSRQQEQIREDFVGSLSKNQITGQVEKIFHSNQRLFRQAVSYTTTLFMIGFVIALTISLFIYRAILLEGGNRGWGPMVLAIANTLQIVIMNIIYDKMAEKLNDWENHKTQSDHDNAFIVKKVGYQFVNYYISLFYIAFIKEHFEGCDNKNCMAELNYNLWVLFTINMVFNLIEVGSPIISAKSQLAAEEKKVQMMQKDNKSVRLEWTYTEKQGKYEKISLLGEYLELAMNYGYIIFFAVAFPLGPLIYWLFNILELRSDSYKFLNLCKRPFPEEASDIGVWSDVMRFLSIVAVITNTGLMIFTQNLFKLPTGDRWWVFIVIEHLILLIMILLMKYYPIVTEFIKNLEVRHEILTKIHYYQNLNKEGSKKAYEQKFNTDQSINFEDKEI